MNGVCARVQEHVNWVLEANHRVVEKDHTVLLNWSERTLPILRQIAESRATGYKVPLSLSIPPRLVYHTTTTTTGTTATR